MDQFVAKPVSKATLVAALTKALPGARAAPAAPRPKRTATPETTTHRARPAPRSTTSNSAIGADAVRPDEPPVRRPKPTPASANSPGPVEGEALVCGPCIR
jgi:hypothetical protein